MDCHDSLQQHNKLMFYYLTKSRLELIDRAGIFVSQLLETAFAMGFHVLIPA